MLNDTIAVLGFGKALPEHQLDQMDTANRLAEAAGDDSHSAQWIKKIFSRSGVSTRYTCEPNLLEPAADCRYMPNQPLTAVPTTAERMKIYKRESVPLSVEAASLALAEAYPTAITHLIVVTCTGFFIPGIDLALIEKLNLSKHVTRIPLTFMGCAAGMTALRIAKQIVEGNPAAQVLIVCVELCTLHIQPSTDREDLFSTAFFGDGAAACVVGRPGAGQKGIFEIGETYTSIIPNCPDDMIWNAGDYGFELILSPKIPEHLAGFAPAAIKRFFGEDTAPEFWAIHPGGRGIIDELQSLLHLTHEQTEVSRSVLSKYGNLSSATILFVLDEMKRKLEASLNSCEEKQGIAIAFGPGLTTEMAKMNYIPSK